MVLPLARFLPRPKCLLLALVIASRPSLAADYTFDNAHSRVGFAVRYMMVSSVKGAFRSVRGTVVIDDADVTNSAVKVEIDTASVDTGIEKRDEHLKSPDFFDVANHPMMTFTSTSLKKQGAKLVVAGDLSLHGVTKPVTLTVEGPTKEWTTPWGQVVRGASATGKINRKDFGLTWERVTDAGGLVVGNEVTLEFDVELVRKQ
jgi:polyisoprenoid-binding protein YceI